MTEQQEVEPTVRDIATVTVSTVVDGTKKRRRRNGNGNTRRAITDTLSLDDCLPEVAAAARAVRRPGQVFQVVSESEVWVRNS